MKIIKKIIKRILAIFNLTIVRIQPIQPPRQDTETNKESLSQSVDVIKPLFINKKCNVTDIFFNQFSDNDQNVFNRLDIVVRYLAIENYYGINETGFFLYKKMQEKRIGEDTELKFIELIKSYENGYDNTSSIILNSALKLLDGSHRIALHIYHEIKNINVAVDSFNTMKPEYSVDWFFINEFTPDEIQIIQDKYYEICKALSTREGLICTIWPPVSNYFNDIIVEMSFYGEVFAVNTIFFDNDYEFESVIKGIYYIDDIADWKIQKKIDFMKSYNKTILIMKLRIDNPFFRLKSLTGFPISRYVERLKKVFRERYKTFIPNYFHDVIIHIADNYDQSTFIDKLLKINLDISDFFKNVNNMEYVISKIETPYMHKDFPHKAPLHKNAYILCSNDFYEKIIEAAFNFSRNFDNEIDTRIKDLTNQTLIRMELSGFLIYQFDISRVLPEFNSSFTDFCIKTRKSYNGCFITNERCEYMIRLCENKKNPQKAHHFSYLQEHKNDFDRDLCNTYLLHPESYRSLFDSLGIDYGA